MKKAVFLDRDGVINCAIIRNGKPHPPKNHAELKVLPGVPEALVKLRKAGWMLIVVTNQPDVARGTVSMEDVEKINRYLMSTLQIDEFRTCYHDDFDKCCCRKPLPGALISAAKYHNIELSESYMVGDRWRDVEAGAAAGCKTIFIDYGYNEKKTINYDHNVHSLVEAAEIIIGNLDD